MLNNGLQVDLSAHNWHLALLCLIISSPYLLKCKTIILNIPMCYTKCHDANIFSLTKEKRLVDK